MKACQSSSPSRGKTAIAPELCPLCGQPNDCQRCIASAYKGPCWCVTADIPEELLARVPAEWRNKACLCRACVTAFQQHRANARQIPISAGDFYFDPRGLIVFTEAYHLRRGYCCGSGCRHCPYPKAGLFAEFL